MCILKKEKDAGYMFVWERIGRGATRRRLIGL